MRELSISGKSIRSSHTCISLQPSVPCEIGPWRVGFRSWTNVISPLINHVSRNLQIHEPYRDVRLRQAARPSRWKRRRSSCMHRLASRSGCMKGRIRAVEQRGCTVPYRNMDMYKAMFRNNGHGAVRSTPQHTLRYRMQYIVTYDCETLAYISYDTSLPFIHHCTIHCKEYGS
jgi:hypothetical protein